MTLSRYVKSEKIYVKQYLLYSKNPRKKKKDKEYNALLTFYFVDMSVQRCEKR